jgi:hypothetical protein
MALEEVPGLLDETLMLESVSLDMSGLSLSQNHIASAANSTNESTPRPVARPTEFVFRTDALTGQTKEGLLALIQSDHFDAWMALACLWRVAGGGREVGLQFYVCERLKGRPQDEIEFLLPQIWYVSADSDYVGNSFSHLVIFMVLDSTPLESFLIEVCQRSLHASIYVSNIEQI